MFPHSSLIHEAALLFICKGYRCLLVWAFGGLRKRSFTSTTTQDLLLETPGNEPRTFCIQSQCSAIDQGPFFYISVFAGFQQHGSTPSVSNSASSTTLIFSSTKLHQKFAKPYSFLCIIIRVPNILLNTFTIFLLICIPKENLFWVKLLSLSGASVH